MKEAIEIKVDDVIFRDDCYPRIEQDPKLVQKYAEDLDVLPPIEINQHNELIDGWHRWTAHKKKKAETIKTVVVETKSDIDLYALAIERNSKFGWQLTEADKKNAAIRLYNVGEGLEKEEVAKTLSVSLRMVNSYLTDIDKQIREARKKKIFEMWLACHTQAEIAAAVELSQKEISKKEEELYLLETLPKGIKLTATYQDEFEPPLYNVWAFGKSSNELKHPGQSEKRILDNLLYLFTEPFDIVVDPFAGGASTVDICKKRLRRYWASDRSPEPEVESIVRKHCVVESGLPPLHKRWSEVSLTYLDPPYWKQVENKYSEDKEDLANMPLEEFTKTLADAINGIAKKQSKGAIALLMQPTQWKADEKQFTDHVFDMLRLADKKRLRLWNRVSCPYQTQQCNAQQVEWAKENKQLLVISRELIIWEIIV
jgi:DNA modification methylase